MTRNWLSRWLSVADTPPAPSPPQLQDALTRYEQALNNLNDDPSTLLVSLLARDHVEAIRQQASVPTTEQVQHLIQLDTRLRQTTAPLTNLADWRASIHPNKAPWWWQLDEAQSKREKERDLLWDILAISFIILTIPLVTDIIGRLWAHAPDNFTISSSLLLLLITASPFTTRGRELAQWVLKRIPRLPARWHTEALLMTAFFAFVLVAFGRFALLPQLAVWYNDRGVVALEAGDVANGQLYLQRATAIDKDFAASYYNLATTYETIAQPEEAITWYKQALAHNLTFSPAYNNLGRLYLEQGNYQQAIPTLQAGLTHLTQATPDEATIHTRYLLLTHLGQAYYELEQWQTARATLTEAIDLEAGQAMDFPSARPHFYLALTYEALEQPADEIIVAWEDALRYLTDEDPLDWGATVRAHLDMWQ